MLTEEEKAMQFQKEYPEICAESKKRMDNFLNHTLQQMKEETEKFRKQIGLIR